MKVPPALQDAAASILNNAPAGSPRVEGDGVAIGGCSGPHFAPHPATIGMKVYCPITEQYWVYARDIGQDGWDVTGPSDDAQPTRFDEFAEKIGKKLFRG